MLCLLTWFGLVWCHCALYNLCFGTMVSPISKVLQNQLMPSCLPPTIEYKTRNSGLWGKIVTFGTLLGLLVLIFIGDLVLNSVVYWTHCKDHLHFGHQLPIPRLTGLAGCSPGQARLATDGWSREQRWARARGAAQAPPKPPLRRRHTPWKQPARALPLLLLWPYIPQTLSCCPLKVIRQAGVVSAPMSAGSRDWPENREFQSTRASSVKLEGLTCKLVAKQWPTGGSATQSSCTQGGQQWKRAKMSMN